MFTKASPWTLGICILSVLFLGCESTKQENPADAAPDTGQTQDASTDIDSGVDASGLPEGIYELKGIEADLPYDDLMPLKDILGDTPLVGMGESIHTSEGYYKTKHRLFRFLVEEMGFRAFSIESPWDDAKLVGDYVATGAGDSFTAVTTGLYSVWASQSMLEMVEWMRQWNVDHPDDPVAFFGFDIQQPWDDGPAIMSFFSDYLPDQAEALNAGIATCDGVSSTSCWDSSNADGGVGMSEEEYKACLDALNAAEATLQEHRQEIIDKTSEETFEIALVRVVGLRAWEAEMYYFSCGPNLDVILGMEARDQGMATVLLKFRDLYYPGQKIAVWAHNDHLAMDFEPWGAWCSMGTLLHQQLGDDYAPIGLVGYKVSINWPDTFPGIGECPLPQGDNVVEVMLHNLDRNYLLVDLAFPGAENPFLLPEEPYGITEPFSSPTLCIPADQFRALVYLDVSPGMESLLW